MPLLARIPLPVFLLAAALLEAGGDALLRRALFGQVVAARLALFVLGMASLTSYGTILNLAPLEFGQVVGLYIATLFVMWQIINFLFFHTLPTVPILTGGLLIVVGGLIVSFWKAA